MGNINARGYSATARANGTVGWFHDGAAYAIKAVGMDFFAMMDGKEVGGPLPDTRDGVTIARLAIERLGLPADV
ncbi:hypothetical protein BIV57_17745 [Mangrovactinospora gilvigrisea]|uniref:Uncharacterized protein n=2 Tax=Mangrovactinospora gilvigrisea TaxID=1428644 RepID=A0A1J7BC40_9ACTN|nr:hypothetical protein BIV57_17745 [Mangrovactinospora gilvigrisea]